MSKKGNSAQLKGILQQGRDSKMKIPIESKKLLEKYQNEINLFHELVSHLMSVRLRQLDPEFMADVDQLMKGELNG